MSLIRLVIGEGKYDRRFLHELAIQIFGKDKVYSLRGVSHDHRKNFRRLQGKLSSYRERRFLESKITVVADNGKNNLVKKFVPRLFGDYVTKMGMKMLVMIDQDSESPQDIFHRISGNVAEKLKAMSKKSKSMSFKYSADPSDYLISAQSEANPSDYFVESRVFIVPKSLEMQIALVAYKKLGKTPKGLDSISPHDAIEQTSKELGLSVEELIEEAARDYHRDKRAEWVGELIRILENYFLWEK